MMPKVGDTAAVGAMGDKEMRRMIAIINSMTPRERRFPDVLNGSRKARIAKGSGTQPSDVNKLLKQYMMMEKMMKKVSSGGIKGLLRALRGGAMGGMGPGPGFGLPGRGMPPKR
jgi:signal recognition particle subunit SRP54